MTVDDVFFDGDGDFFRHFSNVLTKEFENENGRKNKDVSGRGNEPNCTEPTELTVRVRKPVEAAILEIKLRLHRLVYLVIYGRIRVNNQNVLRLYVSVDDFAFVVKIFQALQDLLRGKKQKLNVITKHK
jgi:hypothetical protein